MKLNHGNRDPPYLVRERIRNFKRLKKNIRSVKKMVDNSTPRMINIRLINQSRKESDKQRS